MSDPRERILSRDTAAVQIPSGDPMILPEGSKVFITQTLGGSFTVMTDTGLARITAEEAAGSMGDDLPGTTEADASSEATDSAADCEAPSEEQLWSQLKNVYDPEIPVNIVDLGLVYSLDVKPHEEGGYKVDIKMTLTAPGCGMGPVIADDAKNKLLLAPGVNAADVELVWEPPWHQGMISEEGRMVLGLV